jgi:hypothetical protein
MRCSQSKTHNEKRQAALLAGMQLPYEQTVPALGESKSQQQQQQQLAFLHWLLR